MLGCPVPYGDVVQGAVSDCDAELEVWPRSAVALQTRASAKRML